MARAPCRRAAFDTNKLASAEGASPWNGVALRSSPTCIPARAVLAAVTKSHGSPGAQRRRRRAACSSTREAVTLYCDLRTSRVSATGDYILLPRGTHVAASSVDERRRPCCSSRRATRCFPAARTRGILGHHAHIRSRGPRCAGHRRGLSRASSPTTSEPWSVEVKRRGRAEHRYLSLQPAGRGRVARRSRAGATQRGGTYARS